MLIAFAHTGDNPLIDVFLKSVEGSTLWQITDEETPDLPGCNVFRFPRNGEPFMYWRAKAYAAFNEPGLYCDTDVIVQRDPSPIMVLDFDIALTKTWVVVKDPNGLNLTELMPYNGGVVFVKNKQFWPDVVAHMETQPEEHKEWYGDQFALVAMVKKYNAIELPNTLYNYTPKIKEQGQLLPDKWIIHFKGKRKEWMRNYGLQQSPD